MKTRRSTALTPEGWQYLLIFALVFGGALVNDVNLLLILGSMLVGPLLLSRHLALFTLRGLVVQRRLPRAVCAGDLLVVHLAIANTRRRVGSWILLLEEPIRRLHGPSFAENKKKLEGRSLVLGLGSWVFGAAGTPGRETKTEDLRPKTYQPSVLFPYIPARHTCKGDYRGRLTQRGRYRLGPLRLSTRFPFGLFRYSMLCGTTATVTVLPRLGRLTQGWNALRHESFAGNDRREHRPGVEGDFYGLRPWQRGDSRRWVHWRTSARAGGVMVRQFEQPHSRDAAIVLDLWQPAEPSPAELENVELAVSFAATLAAELCRKGNSDVFLAAADPEPRISGGPGSTALLQDLMERLALVEAQPRDRVPELLQAAAAHVEPGTEIVLVSTRTVDLSSADYAGKLPGDVARRISGRGLRIVDTSHESLGRFFQPE